MYKFIVSCYYWPATDGQLRFRSLRIKSNQRRKGSYLEDSQVVRLTSVDQQNTSTTERRKTPRLIATCETEVKASLAILDSEAECAEESLVFFGRTTDLSRGGLALVLPSTLIDERYCGKSARLKVSLYLPTGPVQMQVTPVRCEQLTGAVTAAMGYFVGAQILSIEDKHDEYDSYLRSIDVTL